MLSDAVNTAVMEQFAAAHRETQDKLNIILEGIQALVEACRVRLANPTPFPPYNPETEDWESYQHRLQQHFVAFGIQDDAAKRSWFLSWLTAGQFQLLGKLSPSMDPAQLSFLQICSLLQKYYENQPHVITARLEFYNCQKRPNQSYRSWAAELQGLAKQCRFQTASGESYADSMIRDAILRNSPDRGFRIQALQLDNPSTEELLKLAQAFVTSREAGRQVEQWGKNFSRPLAKGSREEPMDLDYTTRRPRRDQRRAAPAPRTTGAWKNTTRRPQLPSCAACFTAHPRGQCPHRWDTCVSCGRPGHLEEVCQQPTDPSMPESEADSEALFYMVNTLQSKGSTTDPPSPSRYQPADRSRPLRTSTEEVRTPLHTPRGNPRPSPPTGIHKNRPRYTRPSTPTGRRLPPRGASSTQESHRPYRGPHQDWASRIISSSRAPLYASNGVHPPPRGPVSSTNTHTALSEIPSPQPHRNGSRNQPTRPDGAPQGWLRRDLKSSERRNITKHHSSKTKSVSTKSSSSNKSCSHVKGHNNTRTSTSKRHSPPASCVNNWNNNNSSSRSSRGSKCSSQVISQSNATCITRRWSTPCLPLASPLIMLKTKGFQRLTYHPSFRVTLQDLNIHVSAPGLSDPHPFQDREIRNTNVTAFTPAHRYPSLRSFSFFFQEWAAKTAAVRPTVAPGAPPSTPLRATAPRPPLSVHGALRAARSLPTPLNTATSASPSALSMATADAPAPLAPSSAATPRPPAPALRQAAAPRQVAVLDAASSSAQRPSGLPPRQVEATRPVGIYFLRREGQDPRIPRPITSATTTLCGPQNTESFKKAVSGVPPPEANDEPKPSSKEPHELVPYEPYIISVPATHNGPSPKGAVSGVPPPDADDEAKHSSQEPQELVPHVPHIIAVPTTHGISRARAPTSATSARVSTPSSYLDPLTDMHSIIQAKARPQHTHHVPLPLLPERKTTPLLQAPARSARNSATPRQSEAGNNPVGHRQNPSLYAPPYPVREIITFDTPRRVRHRHTRTSLSREQHGSPVIPVPPSSPPPARPPPVDAPPAAISFTPTGFPHLPPSPLSAQPVTQEAVDRSAITNAIAIFDAIFASSSRPPSANLQGGGLRRQHPRRSRAWPGARHF